MQSHRRPRGKIAFESFCAVCVGASFVGAWVQTGAWAFIGPAFLFALFGLYWAFDIFGREPAPIKAQPVTEPAAEAEIRSERLDLSGIEPQPAVVTEVSPDADVVPFESEVAAVSAKAKPKKARAKKAAYEIPEQIAFVEEVNPEPHIEQLFDPQPFARQVRPAFGKRPRGPGPRPLPAA